MTYTTTTDILKYFNGFAYSDSEGNPNNISETDVEQFIEEQSLIIDLNLKKKYTLPITDATDLNYLKLLCDKLVVCQIDKTLRTFAYDDEEGMSRRRNYCKEAQEMMNKLIYGDIDLNSQQKTFRPFKYNKTTVYNNDCDCRQNLKSCNDD